MENKSKSDRPKYQFGGTQSVPRDALRFDFAPIQIGDNGADAKTAPVKMVARSGKPTEHWFWGNVVHDMAGMKLAKSHVPIDYCHDCEKVIGFANKFDISTGDLILSGALVPYSANEDDKATEVLYKAKAGVPYEASINFGGDGIKIQEVMPGEVTPVNGYQFSGPGIVIREWPLRGVAICPYGQDMNTSAEFSASDQVPITLFNQEKPAMSTTTPTEATKPAVEVEPTPTPATEAKPATPPAAAVELAQQKPAIPVEAATTSPESPVVEAPGKSGLEFVAAFGDVGARWFLEGRKFKACAAEFIGGMKKEHSDAIANLSAVHKAAVEAKDAEIADLKGKLAAMPRGNEAAGFSAEPGKKNTDTPEAAKLKQNLGPNLGAFAAGMVFAEPAKSTLPIKK